MLGVAGPETDPMVTPVDPNNPDNPDIFDPGGGSDIAARSILSYTEKYLGGTFAIENRPGAGGIVGWTAIATGDLTAILWA